MIYLWFMMYDLSSQSLSSILFIETMVIIICFCWNIPTTFKLKNICTHCCIANKTAVIKKTTLFNGAWYRLSQIACSVTTMPVTCTQTVFSMHEISCRVLIENKIKNYLFPAHIHHYALKKKNHYHCNFNFRHSSPKTLQP